MNITLDKKEVEEFYKKLEKWSNDLESYISANFIKKYEECLGRVRDTARNDPDLFFKFAVDVIIDRLDKIDLIMCNTVNFELIRDYKKLHPMPKIL